MRIRFLIAAALCLIQVSAMAQGTDLDAWNNRKLPTFKMKTADGKTITNKSLLGKVVLIDFWATWCGPCKAGMPMMQRLHKAYGKKGLVMIGADVWEHPDAGKAPIEYPKKNKLTYTFTLGNDSLAKVLGLTSIPVVLVVDKTGTIRRIVVGYGGTEEEKSLKADVQRLLAAK